MATVKPASRMSNFGTAILHAFDLCWRNHSHDAGGRKGTCRLKSIENDCSGRRAAASDWHDVAAGRRLLVVGGSCLRHGDSEPVTAFGLGAVERLIGLQK